MFLSLQEPAILLGDLNDGAKNKEISALLASPGVHDPIDERLGANAGRVDWILTRGLRTVNVGRTEAGASDHEFFWADLEFLP